LSHPVGSLERRSRERADTRQRILDAAREMFVRRGYEATTMRAIADRIEYTPTAIYHHFRNKEALLAELCTLDFRALASAFQKIGRIEDPIERLRRTGLVYIQFGLEHPMQYQLMFMTRRPKEVGGRIHGEDPSESAYEFLRQTCADVIATGRLRTEYRDADELALMAWSSLHGLLSIRIVMEDEEWIHWRDAKATATRICDTLLEGVLRVRPK
jgi:AcrR family transcriptional regulator